MAVADWRLWAVPQWNEKLLDHFFGRQSDDDPPVATLLVTPEELARSVGDPTAKPSDVRNAFVAAVLAGIARSGSLLFDASDYGGWPKPPDKDNVPRFLSHLIFTCIAASESSDELATEGSFIERLRELTQNRLPDNSLPWLPRLWENLAAWLRCQVAYRELVLPNPGGYTRIGHTIKLAFPDRRDQRQLSALIDGAGLSNEEPPVGKVISLVSSWRARFRRGFLEAFDDFRRRLEADGPQARSVNEHRFWSAVRTAALRGRGIDDGPRISARIQLLADEQDNRLFPFIVTDAAIADSSSVTTIELPVSYGAWRFALVTSESPETVSDRVHASMRALLERRLVLPVLSGLVTQGLLPFAEAAHGCLELAHHDLDQVSVVLARADLAKSLIERFGHRALRNDSNFEGWIELYGLKLHKLPSSDIDNTALQGCWILYESIVMPRFRIRGGVRADDGWLGFKEVLPRVAISGASEVVLKEKSGQIHALVRDGAGEWEFPAHDLTGECQISARMDDDTSLDRSFRFSSNLGIEAFRPPRERESWIVEQVGGTADLSVNCPMTTTVADAEVPTIEWRRAYLGPVVGQFLNAPEAAAWIITNFAGRKLGARCRPDLAEASARARISDASARSRWRRWLLNSVADPADPGFEAARRAIRKRALKTDLPTVDTPTIFPCLQHRTAVQIAPAVDRLLTIVGGLASRRIGLAWPDWTLLTQRVLGVDKTRVGAITRAWAEAGAIDVASYARWRNRCVFARPPVVALFRVGLGFGGTVMGMLLPSTRSAVRAACTSHGVLIEQRAGVSVYVPPVTTLRASSREALERVFQLTGLESAWFDPVLESYAASCRHDGRSLPPLHYEHQKSWARWSLRPCVDGSLTFEHCVRSDRPDYWVVSDAGRLVWSFDLNTCRLWAAAMLGEPAVELSGSTDLQVVHGYVPLPLARALTVLTGAPAGPDEHESQHYKYPIGSTELRDRILTIMRRTFDPARLSSEQAVTE
jgi:hypothetical protein